MTDPFSPPVAPPSPPGALTNVLLAWMFSGAAMGAAVGLTAQLTGTPQTLATALGIGCLTITTGFGGLVYRLERQIAADRPAVLDHRGQLGRPIHGVLYAAPMVLMAGALVVLFVVVSVAVQSLLPAIFFGLGGFALGWASRKVHTTHHLNTALQFLELGEIEEATHKLHQLEKGWLSTRTGRTTARLNLGLLALSDGDLERAARYYRQVRGGSGQTFAQTGLALVQALDNRLDDAEATLLLAMTGAGASSFQGQLDAVRLLITLRREGPDAASALGKNLLSPDSGELFCGLLSAARQQAGDQAGSRQLLDPTTVETLQHSWASVVPEIAEVLVLT